MREFEDRFISLGLNYRVVGGPRFYERMEIRDAMAYFRIVCQPGDDLAFERIVNTPKRGIGEASFRIIHDKARSCGISLTRAVAELCETEMLKPRQRFTLKTLLNDFTRWSDNLNTMDHTELAEMILEESGYIKKWQEERTPDATGSVRKFERIDSLYRSV